MVQTRDGAMWFGTTDGISRFDASAGGGTSAWTTYTTEDGLASNRASWIRGLFQARDGTLWAGHGSRFSPTDVPSQISRFDGQTFTNLTN